MSNFIINLTLTQSKDRRVIGLSEGEKQRIKAGGLVLFRSCYPSKAGSKGTLWRYVKYYPQSNIFVPRVPSTGLIKQAERQIQEGTE